MFEVLRQCRKNDSACLSLTFEQGDDFGAVVGVSLAVDVAQVGLDGGFADKERVLDVLETVTRHPEGEDVGLALGQPAAGEHGVRGHGGLLCCQGKTAWPALR